MSAIEEVTKIVASTLQLGERARTLRPDTRLLGALPELDSVSVIGIVTALEERFGIAFEDGEIHASIFDSIQSLAEFVDKKLLSS